MRLATARIQDHDIHLRAQLSIDTEQTAFSDDRVGTRQPVPQQLCPVLFAFVASSPGIFDRPVPDTLILRRELIVILLQKSPKLMIRSRRCRGGLERDVEHLISHHCCLSSPGSSESERAAPPVDRRACRVVAGVAINVAGIAMDECPSMSATALICTPASSQPTAADCRRVCTPTPATPAASAASSMTRRKLRGST